MFGLASVDLVEVEAPTWHIAQHLPAIRWVPLHCICHHCMAPQTWHNAQYLLAIRWLPLHLSSLYGSSDMARCSTPACHQVSPPALHLLLLESLMDMAHRLLLDSTWKQSLECLRLLSCLSAAMKGCSGQQ